MANDWRISCSIEALRARAELLARVRDYFRRHQVLEVETPLLGHGTGTDIHLQFFNTDYTGGKEPDPLYLQTSPEFSMKRLLASGSGSIYQICKAFRNGEQGRLHNPEFTILEWYRLGYDLRELMSDVSELLADLLQPGIELGEPLQVPYRDIFYQHTGLDALQFDQEQYEYWANSSGLPEAVGLCADDHASWLDFLFSHQVQEHLGRQGLTMIYDYPSCLPSLARLDAADNRIARRVEVFYLGLELGNGYQELTDYDEQRTRFTGEVERRRILGLPQVEPDHRFLKALRQGMPDCSGIAIGLDRLLMLITGARHIDQVLAFPLERA